jgi:hypothetical protein
MGYDVGGGTVSHCSPYLGVIMSRVKMDTSSMVLFLAALVATATIVSKCNVEGKIFSNSQMVSRDM